MLSRISRGHTKQPDDISDLFRIAGRKVVSDVNGTTSDASADSPSTVIPAFRPATRQRPRQSAGPRFPDKESLEAHLLGTDGKPEFEPIPVSRPSTKYQRTASQASVTPSDSLHLASPQSSAFESLYHSALSSAGGSRLSSPLPFSYASRNGTAALADGRDTHTSQTRASSVSSSNASSSNGGVVTDDLVSSLSTLLSAQLGHTAHRVLESKSRAATAARGSRSYTSSAASRSRPHTRSTTDSFLSAFKRERKAEPAAVIIQRWWRLRCERNWFVRYRSAVLRAQRRTLRTPFRVWAGWCRATRHYNRRLLRLCFDAVTMYAAQLRQKRKQAELDGRALQRDMSIVGERAHRTTQELDKLAYRFRLMALKRLKVKVFQEWLELSRIHKKKLLEMEARFRKCAVVLRTSFVRGAIRMWHRYAKIKSALRRHRPLPADFPQWLDKHPTWNIHWANWLDEFKARQDFMGSIAELCALSRLRRTLHVWRTFTADRRRTKENVRKVAQHLFNGLRKYFSAWQLYVSIRVDERELLGRAFRGWLHYKKFQKSLKTNYTLITIRRNLHELLGTFMRWKRFANYAVIQTAAAVVNLRGRTGLAFQTVYAMLPPDRYGDLFLLTRCFRAWAALARRRLQFKRYLYAARQHRDGRLMRLCFDALRNKLVPGTSLPSPWQNAKQVLALVHNVRNGLLRPEDPAIDELRRFAELKDALRPEDDESAAASRSDNGGGRGGDDDKDSSTESKDGKKKKKKSGAQQQKKPNKGTTAAGDGGGSPKRDMAYSQSADGRLGLPRRLSVDSNTPRTPGGGGRLRRRNSIDAATTAKVARDERSAARRAQMSKLLELPERKQRLHFLNESFLKWKKSSDRDAFGLTIRLIVAENKQLYRNKYRESYRRPNPRALFVRSCKTLAAIGALESQAAFRSFIHRLSADASVARRIRQYRFLRDNYLLSKESVTEAAVSLNTLRPEFTLDPPSVRPRRKPFPPMASMSDEQFAAALGPLLLRQRGHGIEFGDPRDIHDVLAALHAQFRTNQRGSELLSQAMKDKGQQVRQASAVLAQLPPDGTSGFPSITGDIKVWRMVCDLIFEPDEQQDNERCDRYLDMLVPLPKILEGPIQAHKRQLEEQQEREKLKAKLREDARQQNLRALQGKRTLKEQLEALKAQQAEAEMASEDQVKQLLDKVHGVKGATPLLSAHSATAAALAPGAVADGPDESTAAIESVPSVVGDDDGNSETKQRQRHLGSKRVGAAAAGGSGSRRSGAEAKADGASAAAAGGGQSRQRRHRSESSRSLMAGDAGSKPSRRHRGARRLASTSALASATTTNGANTPALAGSGGQSSVVDEEAPDLLADADSDAIPFATASAYAGDGALADDGGTTTDGETTFDAATADVGAAAAAATGGGGGGMFELLSDPESATFAGNTGTLPPPAMIPSVSFHDPPAVRLSTPTAHAGLSNASPFASAASAKKAPASPRAQPTKSTLRRTTSQSSKKSSSSTTRASSAASPHDIAVAQDEEQPPKEQGQQQFLADRLEQLRASFVAATGGAPAAAAPAASSRQSRSGSARQLSGSNSSSSSSSRRVAHGASAGRPSSSASASGTADELLQPQRGNSRPSSGSGSRRSLSFNAAAADPPRAASALGGSRSQPLSRSGSGAVTLPPVVAGDERRSSSARGGASATDAGAAAAAAPYADYSSAASDGGYYSEGFVSGLSRASSYYSDYDSAGGSGSESDYGSRPASRGTARSSSFYGDSSRPPSRPSSRPPSRGPAAAAAAAAASIRSSSEAAVVELDADGRPVPLRVDASGLLRSPSPRHGGLLQPLAPRPGSRPSSRDAERPTSRGTSRGSRPGSRGAVGFTSLAPPNANEQGEPDDDDDDEPLPLINSNSGGNGRGGALLPQRAARFDAAATAASDDHDDGAVARADDERDPAAAVGRSAAASQQPPAVRLAIVEPSFATAAAAGRGSSSGNDWNDAAALPPRFDAALRPTSAGLLHGWNSESPHTKMAAPAAALPSGTAVTASSLNRTPSGRQLLASSHHQDQLSSDSDTPLSDPDLPAIDVRKFDHRFKVSMKHLAAVQQHSPPPQQVMFGDDDAPPHGGAEAASSSLPSEEAKDGSNGYSEMLKAGGWVPRAVPLDLDRRWKRRYGRRVTTTSEMLKAMLLTSTATDEAPPDVPPSGAPDHPLQSHGLPSSSSTGSRPSSSAGARLRPLSRERSGGTAAAAAAGSSGAAAGPHEPRRLTFADRQATGSSSDAEADAADAVDHGGSGQQQPRRPLSRSGSGISLREATKELREATQDLRETTRTLRERELDLAAVPPLVRELSAQVDKRAREIMLSADLLIPSAATNDSVPQRDEQLKARRKRAHTGPMSEERASGSNSLPSLVLTPETLAQHKFEPIRHYANRPTGEPKQQQQQHQRPAPPGTAATSSKRPYTQPRQQQPAAAASSSSSTVDDDLPALLSVVGRLHDAPGATNAQQQLAAAGSSKKPRQPAVATGSPLSVIPTIPAKGRAFWTMSNDETSSPRRKPSDSAQKQRRAAHGGPPPPLPQRSPSESLLSSWSSPRSVTAAAAASPNGNADIDMLSSSLPEPPRVEAGAGPTHSRPPGVEMLKLPVDHVPLLLPQLGPASVHVPDSTTDGTGNSSSSIGGSSAAASSARPRPSSASAAAAATAGCRPWSAPADVRDGARSGNRDKDNNAPAASAASPAAVVADEQEQQQQEQAQATAAESSSSSSSSSSSLTLPRIELGVR